MKLFIGSIVNNEEILNRILLRSSFTTPLRTVKAGNATDGLNKLLEMAELDGADIALLCHQDMYFPPGWPDTLKEKIKELPESWIVAGFYGRDKLGDECGHIHDRRSPIALHTTHSFPVEALSLDACAMVFNICKDFRFEFIQGFDLYDVFAVLRAREMGGTAWIIDCPPDHYNARSVYWKASEAYLKTLGELKKRFPEESVLPVCSA